mgnify:CR=1 FL=1
MRTILLIFLIFSIRTTTAQNGTDTIKNYPSILYGDNLKLWLDSLKNHLLADTANFKETDLLFTAAGRRNTKTYCPLFIVNGSYFYKLDIVNGSQVMEFINEILDCKKIKSASLFDSSKAISLFAQDAIRGVIAITMLDKVKFNPKVAGLTLHKKNSGDNFTKRKKSEILLHE